MSTPRRNNRKVLTLEDRVKVIEQSNKGMSAASISRLIDCGKTQIQNIIRDKASIMALWESGEGRADQKLSKVRKVCYKKLDELVWEWFSVARSKNLPITGRMIQQQAITLSLPLGHDDFMASNGWLDRWKTRHKVKSSVLSGEAADVNPETVDDWIKRLPTICDGYKAEDIFNADETGLFYRSLPTRSMVAKGDKCKGGKSSKERMTVLLCCSAADESCFPLSSDVARSPDASVAILAPSLSPIKLIDEPG